MLLRAFLAFIILPGTVAFMVPLLWLRPRMDAAPVHWLGLLPLSVGTLLLLWCVRDFYVAGKGTLAPWEPPKHLVVIGLYRWSRNPMYLSVTLILLGWTLFFRSTTLLLYTAVVMLAFYLRVVLVEEPWLARRHGQAWDRYRGQARRWF